MYTSIPTTTNEVAEWNKLKYSLLPEIQIVERFSFEDQKPKEIKYTCQFCGSVFFSESERETCQILHGDRMNRRY